MDWINLATDLTIKCFKKIEKNCPIRIEILPEIDEIHDWMGIFRDMISWFWSKLIKGFFFLLFKAFNCLNLIDDTNVRISERSQGQNESENQVNIKIIPSFIHFKTINRNLLILEEIRNSLPLCLFWWGRLANVCNSNDNASTNKQTEKREEN